MDAPEQVYQLKVRLLGISPMIWRRVLVPVSVTLRELHGVLQVVMGWEGIHLFLFDIYAVRYDSFDLHIANPDVSLLEFGLRGNARFSYIYDMVNYWEHEIRVEAIDPPSRKFHPVCTGGGIWASWPTFSAMLWRRTLRTVWYAISCPTKWKPLWPGSRREGLSWKEGSHGAQ